MAGWRRKAKGKKEEEKKADAKPAEAPPPEESPYGKPTGSMANGSSGRYGYWDMEGKYVPYKNGEYDEDGNWVKKTGMYTSSYSSGYYRSWYDDDDGDGDYGSYFGKKVKGKSSSSFWSSRFSSWSSGWSSKKGPDYASILASVKRSANIVSNATHEDQAERELKVEWSNGQGTNSAKSDVIYLSPDVVDAAATRKKDWTEDERTDVLIGEALCESTLRRTMDPKVEDAFSNTTDTLKGQLEHALWYASERIEAEGQVISEYPGFKGYFAAHRDYYTDKNAQKTIQEALDKEETAVNAALALMWEMLHPAEHLSLPAKTQELVKTAYDSFADAQNSTDRAYRTKAAIAAFIKQWPLPPEMQKQMQQSMQLQEGAEGEGQPTAFRGELVQGNEEARKSAEELKLQGIVDKNEEYDASVEHGVQTYGSDVHNYQRLVRNLNGSIQDLRRRLKFRNEIAKITEHGLRRGDLDEGSLYKLGFYPHGVDDPNLFEERSIHEPPEVAVTLLIDESGSMGGGHHRPRYEHARDTAIIIANALLGLKGISVSVLGHTAEGEGQDGCEGSGLILHHYYTPERNKYSNLASLSKVHAFANNVDGYAIAHTALHMKKWHPDVGTRLLIHISDGLPCAAHYGSMSAEAHMRKVVECCAKEGIQVIGIGIDNAFSEAKGKELYGENRSVVIPNTSATAVVANIISRYALRKSY